MRGLQDGFHDRLYASIALVPEAQRVPEIDHTLRWDFAPADLLNAVKLGCEKLSYIAQPPREPIRTPFVIEDISTEREMLDYARLRHRIYRVMGYMEEQLWDAPLRAELEWSDTTAMHVGAFMTLPNRRRQLVGGRESSLPAGFAAIARPLPSELPNWTRFFANTWNAPSCRCACRSSIHRARLACKS